MTVQYFKQVKLFESWCKLGEHWLEFLTNVHIWLIEAATAPTHNHQRWSPYGISFGAGFQLRQTCHSTFQTTLAHAIFEFYRFTNDS